MLLSIDTAGGAGSGSTVADFIDFKQPTIVISSWSPHARRIAPSRVSLASSRKETKGLRKYPMGTTRVSRDIDMSVITLKVRVSKGCHK